MELTDLKNTWDHEKPNPGQQKITVMIIDRMTQKKYQSKIKKITYPELAGSLICVAAAVFIGTHFNRLDTAFLQSVGVVSILLLLLLPIISFLSLQQLTAAADLNKPYAEALKVFAVQRLRFYKWQKINVTLSYLLLVTIVILLSRILGSKHITDHPGFWTFSFTIGYLLLLFFSRFVSVFYKKTLQQTEELLQALQAEPE